MEKDLFKLMNNSVFGKTMENVYNRHDVRLYRLEEEREITKVLSSPNYLSRTLIGENMLQVQMAPEKVILDKPIYTGMAILDISKTLMYDFWYIRCN